MSFRLLHTALIIFALAACTSNAPFTQNESLNENNASTLIVYTPDTSFNRQNFIYPTIFIDGHAAGKVSIKNPLQFFLEPGPHTITFQRAFVVMTNYEAGKIDIQLEQGKTYYIRYSYDFDDRVTNAEPSASGASSFRLVPPSQGETRK